MALSLSGDDEEYDSESEQVRAPTLHYITSMRSCVFLSKSTVRNKGFCDRFSSHASGQR